MPWRCLRLQERCRALQERRLLLRRRRTQRCRAQQAASEINVCYASYHHRVITRRWVQPLRNPPLQLLPLDKTHADPLGDRQVTSDNRRTSLATPCGAQKSQSVPINEKVCKNVSEHPL